MLSSPALEEWSTRDWWYDSNNYGVRVESWFIKLHGFTCFNDCVDYDAEQTPLRRCLYSLARVYANSLLAMLNWRRPQTIAEITILKASESEAIELSTVNWGLSTHFAITVWNWSAIACMAILFRSFIIVKYLWKAIILCQTYNIANLNHTKRDTTAIFLCSGAWMI